MKKLLSVPLFILFTYLAHSQGPVAQYLGSPKSYLVQRGWMVNDSGFAIRKDTSVKPPPTLSANWAFIATIHDSLFIWNGFGYSQAKASAGASAPTLPSVSSVRATVGPTAGFIANTSGYYTKGDGGGSTYYWDDVSTATDDGIFTIKPTSISSGSPGRWRKVSMGRLNVMEAGVKNDGTDQTAILNTIAANSLVKEILFSNGNTTITGQVDFNGKTAVFQNGAMLTGSGKIKPTGLQVVAAENQQIFGTSLVTDSALTNSTIEVMWFGAKPDMTLNGSTFGVTNNQPLFKKALDAARTAEATPYYSYRKKLHIPGAPTDKAYYMDSTWTINAEVEAYGDGFMQSILSFKAGVVGIHVAFPNFTGSVAGAHQPYLHDFHVISVVGVGTGDNYSHGFLIDCAGFYERLWADYFAGDAIHVRGNTPLTNSSMSRIMDCRGRACAGSGLFFEGSDAQVIQIIGGDYSYNSRFGVWDRGFLGNAGFGIHVDGNGRYNDYNRSSIAIYSAAKGYWVQYIVVKSVIKKVSHNGVRYHCIAEHDATTATEPGVGANWTTVWASDGAGGQDNTYWYWSSVEHYVVNSVIPEVTPGWQAYYDFWGNVPSATNPASALNVAYDAELPSLNVAYWKRFDTTVAWQSSGSYRFDGGNQQGSYVGCYFEQDEAFPKNNASTIIMGGFASNKGVGAGAIGFNFPYIIMEALQVKNSFGGKNSGLRVSPDLDSTDVISSDIQLFDDKNNRVWHNYILSDGVIESGPVAGSPLSQQFIGGVGTYVSRLGLTAMPTEGAITFPQGVYMGRNKSVTNQRYVGSGTARPSTGYHAEGEIILNSSETILDTVYWKCTAAGTPGTWIGVTGGGGGGVGTDANAFHKGGDAVGTSTSIGVTGNVQLDVIQNGVTRQRFMGAGNAGRTTYGGTTDYGYVHNFTGNAYYNDAVVYNSSVQAAQYNIAGVNSYITMSGVNTLIVGGGNASGHLIGYSGAGGKQAFDADNNGVFNISHGIQLNAGTTTEYPLKFQSGTNLTTPQNGAMEYNGSHIYITIGGTRYQLDQQGGGGGGTADTLVARRGLAITSGASVDTIDARNFRVDAFTADVGNIGTGEDNLMSVSINAKLMANEGDGVDFTMTFNTAANANAKTIKIYFGLTSIVTLSSLSSSGGLITINGKIIRNATGGQRCIVWYNSVNNSQSTVLADLTESMTGFLTLKATGTAVSDNDIVQKVIVADFRQNDSVH